MPPPILVPVKIDGVQEEVEAALLNSQGPPWDEVFVALCGVIRFARNELSVVTDEHLRKSFESALSSPRSKAPE